MSLSTWVREQIEARARHHRLVWVHDPYTLLEATELTVLLQDLNSTGHSLLAVKNALQLRDGLDGRDPLTAKLVLLDQSYTLRDAHLLPKDAQPADLLPLRAPDWKPQVDTEAFFKPTVRDFLCHLTGDEQWPAAVNVYPYEKLARDDPHRFAQTYDTFCRTGRAPCDDDLVIVGASAFFGTDLFEVSQPLAALELAFHQQEKWEALRELFNPAEIEVIQKRLQAMPQPIGDLFGPNEENARLALAALVILRQHFEEPGRHLPVLSPSLAQYQDCTVGLCTEAASWFVEEEVPRFEKLIGETFRKHLHTTLQLNNEEQARAFAQRERFSSKLRALTPFAIKADKKSARLDGKQDFSLDRLVPEFQEVKRRLLDLLNITKPLIERLNLTALRDQSIAKVLDIFDKRGFYQLDQIVGRLNGLIRDVEGPAQRQWKTVSGFEDVWVKEVRECRDAMSTASRLRNDLDYLFGRLLEARYGELVPGEFLTTDQFYEQWMGPRRRGAQGEVRKAVVLIIDSMRLDIWRQLVQPALEREYAVEEVLGLARLPSETHVSRRAFFAGKPPAQVPMAGKESDLLADQLSRFHAATITLETVRIQRPGLVFGVQTKDKATYAGVFDFADRLSHDVDWDPHTVQEALRPLIREVRAVLAEAGPEALVFIAADHGHNRLQGGRAIYLDDADDVGYHSGYVAKRVEGQNAAHVFQIPAHTLGHNLPGLFVFPKPGFYLRRASDTSGRPGAGYRHGGLSLFEVVVPLVCLRHRDAPTKVNVKANIRGSVVTGMLSTVEVSLSADGIVSSPLKLVANSSDIESMVVSGVSSTPKMVTLRYTPTAPGRQSVKLTAYLADDPVGIAELEVNVAPAPVEEDPAKAKLKKFFGDT
jgi:hypothetical protein